MHTTGLVKKTGFRLVVHLMGTHGRTASLIEEHSMLISVERAACCPHGAIQTSMTPTSPHPTLFTLAPTLNLPSLPTFPPLPTHNHTLSPPLLPCALTPSLPYSTLPPFDFPNLSRGVSRPIEGELLTSSTNTSPADPTSTSAPNTSNALGQLGIASCAHGGNTQIEEESWVGQGHTGWGQHSCLFSFLHNPMLSCCPAGQDKLPGRWPTVTDQAEKVPGSAQRGPCLVCVNPSRIR